MSCCAVRAKQSYLERAQCLSTFLIEQNSIRSGSPRLKLTVAPEIAPD
jgi:hypothetical protein